MDNNCRINTKISVIIVAGGSGNRMGANIPKQFLILGDKPILMHTIERFYEAIPSAELILVMSSTEFDRWETLCKKYTFEIPHKTTCGGSTRFSSVKNGINAASLDSEIIMIHDGVRPFIDKTTIFNTLGALPKTGAVIPAINLVDSIREEKESGIYKVADRTKFKLIQTPQVFYSEIIRKSYNRNDNALFTDDATVAEYSGYEITLCEGNSNNIKITSPIDLAIGNVILKHIH
ncbi:MAG: 2-C-methyl-D-erythritol 4-phosphate cytidylyltransferase [Rikenellaceae bacterium]